MACKMYWIYMSKRPHEAGCLVMFSLMVKCRKIHCLIPITSVGWLAEKRWEIWPSIPIGRESGFKIRVVWVQIPPGLPRVDVCTIVSASTKSKIVGFAGSARKPANEVIKCLSFLGLNRVGSSHPPKSTSSSSLSISRTLMGTTTRLTLHGFESLVFVVVPRNGALWILPSTR